MSTDGLRPILKAAEQLGRAQHLLRLCCDDNEERLKNYHLEITLPVADGPRCGELIDTQGNGCVSVKSRICISLRNRGPQRVYVSVFMVNVAGEICLISASNSAGIPINIGTEYIIGRRKGGLGLSWPENVPQTNPVREHLAFVITDHEVDLRALETFEDSAEFRNIERDISVEHVCYDVIHIPFMLCAS